MRLNEVGIIYYQGNEITRIYTENQIIYDINNILNLAVLDKTKFMRFFGSGSTIIFRDTPVSVPKRDGSIYRYKHENIATDDSLFSIDAYSYIDTMTSQSYKYIYCPRIISLPEDSSYLFKNMTIDFNNRVTTRFTKNFNHCFYHTFFSNIEFDFTNAEQMFKTFEDSNITDNNFKLANTFISHSNYNIYMCRTFVNTNIGSVGLNSLLTKSFFTSHIVDLNECFADCKQLTEINLTHLNLNLIINTDDYYYYCWENTFKNCTKLSHIIFPSFPIPQNKKGIRFDYTFYNCSLLAETDIQYLLQYYDLSHSYFFESFCNTQLSEICLTDTGDGSGEFFGQLEYPFTGSDLHTLILGKVNMSPSRHCYLRGGCNCDSLINLTFSPYYENFSSEITAANADIAPKSDIDITNFFKDTNFTQYNWFNKIIFNYTPKGVFENCLNLTSGRLNVYNATQFEETFENQKNVSWDLYCFYSQIPPNDIIRDNQITFVYDKTFTNSDNSSLNHIIFPSLSQNWTQYSLIGILNNTFNHFDGDINLINHNMFKNLIEVAGKDIFIDSTAQYIDFNFKLYGASGTFQHCANLISINHNNAIQIIKSPYNLSYTFTGCVSLQEIRLQFPELTYNNSPLHVSFILRGTFNDCSSLTGIYVYDTWEDFTRNKLRLYYDYSWTDPSSSSSYIIPPNEDNTTLNPINKYIIFDHCYQLPGFWETEERIEGEEKVYIIKSGTIMTGWFGKSQGQRIGFLIPYREDN